VKLTAFVPATAANLGPGFDCLGLALDLCNEVTVDTEAPPGVLWAGEGAGELPTDGSDMTSRAMARLARSTGLPLPPLALHGLNRIPLERGLGSSAAAVVGGLCLADRLLGAGLALERLLEIAVDVEGHADNVAAALFGGLVIAYRFGERWEVEALVPYPALRPVVLVPEHVRLATSAARSALPEEVPLADAAFNAGRAALMPLALTHRPDLLRAAIEDRLHQPARLALVPEVREVFERVREAGVPVCVSGAGPSLLAFEGEGPAVPDLGPGWRILRVAPRVIGAEIA